MESKQLLIQNVALPSPDWHLLAILVIICSLQYASDSPDVEDTNVVYENNDQERKPIKPCSTYESTQDTSDKGHNPCEYTVLKANEVAKAGRPQIPIIVSIVNRKHKFLLNAK